MTRPFSLLPLLPFFLLACGPETPEPAPPGAFAVRATAQAGDFEAKLFAKTELHVGRNVVRYEVYDPNGSRLTEAEFSHSTTMHMHGHEHSSPSIDPGNHGEGEIVFTMPSGEMGTWDVALTVRRTGEDDLVFVFESVPVRESTARKDLVVGETKYIVTLNFEGPFVVGQNPFVLTVHEVGHHDFPPVETLEVTMTPEMPTMGHGSPDNVQPVHKSNGNYEGSVNLTMPGLWHLDFKLGDLGTVEYALEF